MGEEGASKDTRSGCLLCDKAWGEGGREGSKESKVNIYCEASEAKNGWMEGWREGERAGGLKGRADRTGNGSKFETDEPLGEVGHAYSQEADNDASDCREQPSFDRPRKRERCGKVR